MKSWVKPFHVALSHHDSQLSYHIIHLVYKYVLQQTTNLTDHSLDSSVGRASAFGAGGRGFESRGRTIPKV